MIFIIYVEYSTYYYTYYMEGERVVIQMRQVRKKKADKDSLLRNRVVKKKGGDSVG